MLEKRATQPRADHTNLIPLTRKCREVPRGGGVASRSLRRIFNAGTLSSSLGGRIRCILLLSTATHSNFVRWVVAGKFRTDPNHTKMMCDGWEGCER